MWHAFPTCLPSCREERRRRESMLYAPTLPAVDIMGPFPPLRLQHGAHTHCIFHLCMAAFSPKLPSPLCLTACSAFGPFSLLPLPLPPLSICLQAGVFGSIYLTTFLGGEKTASLAFPTFLFFSPRACTHTSSFAMPFYHACIALWPLPLKTGHCTHHSMAVRKTCFVTLLHFVFNMCMHGMAENMLLYVLFGVCFCLSYSLSCLNNMNMVHYGLDMLLSTHFAVLPLLHCSSLLYHPNLSSMPSLCVSCAFPPPPNSSHHHHLLPSLLPPVRCLSSLPPSLFSTSLYKTFCLYVGVGCFALYWVVIVILACFTHRLNKRQDTTRCFWRRVLWPDGRREPFRGAKKKEAWRRKLITAASPTTTCHHAHAHLPRNTSSSLLAFTIVFWLNSIGIFSHPCGGRRRKAGKNVRALILYCDDRHSGDGQAQAWSFPSYVCLSAQRAGSVVSCCACAFHTHANANRRRGTWRAPLPHATPFCFHCTDPLPWRICCWDRQTFCV